MTKTDEIVLASENEANAVLSAMKDILNKYEQVTFADLLELVGIASVYKDNRIGWTSLRNVEVKAVKDGFILDLPSTKEL
jgi:hypothetical protein